MLAQATDFDLAIAELDSAESFLDFFNIQYDPDYLLTRRVQFLRLFQRQLSKQAEPKGWDAYHQAVSRAYCELERNISVAFADSHCSTCQSDCSTKGEGKC